MGAGQPRMALARNPPSPAAWDWEWTPESASMLAGHRLAPASQPHAGVHSGCGRPPMKISRNLGSNKTPEISRK